MLSATLVVAHAESGVASKRGGADGRYECASPPMSVGGRSVADLAVQAQQLNASLERPTKPCRLF